MARCHEMSGNFGSPYDTPSPTLYLKDNTSSGTIRLTCVRSTANMIAFLLLLGAVSVYGQGHHGHNHSCIHNNHQQQTADQVITKVIADLDKDGDGAVAASEVLAEFAANYDKNGDGEISETEFVHQWHHTYHDTHPFAGYLYTHFDMNSDNKLTDSDVTAMEALLDTDGDGKLSVAEFKAAMTNLYKNCVTAHGR